MTSLYSCKPTQDRETFLIAKFDDNLQIQSSYFVGPKKCQCEAWVKRKQCRHLGIRSMFMSNHHTNDGWFLDFDTRQWRNYPQLTIDGRVGEPEIKLDSLAIGDNGYQTEAASPQAPLASVSAEALAFSTSASAPEVEQPSSASAPSGASLNLPSDGGIKRRKGL